MTSLELAKLIPWIPALGAVLCGLCCIRPWAHKLAGPICVLSILGSLILSLCVYSDVVGTGQHLAGAHVTTLYTWMTAGDLTVSMGYFLDGLTMVMLFVVTGIGTLIATYAMGYMKHDPGYPRFFAGVALFIFAMLTLVMADNLILLYLGWEGVGLCSYLLIGYYYQYDVAVAAAKKAFIVNRVGDLGFALGIFLTYQVFGSVDLNVIIPAATQMVHDGASSTALTWIPFLLMIGAFGKSAQIPLYTWLPDAMAGPTPVSALVHAATMVTAGVYMIARLTPIFQLSPWALPTVALVGAVTCLFAATIALNSNDLKGVFAYSTVSQIGYMFIGVGVGSVGGVFHLSTHAFFKALLFLTAGSVMHALAGNLDMRTMGGLRKKMPVTCWLMFAGCLALAGVPFTSGFYSKDLILGDAMAVGQTWATFAGVLGLITAFLTAFYTFRLWFTVFMGEEKYDMGDAHHTPDNEIEKAMIAVAKEEAEHTGHAAHGPHEMSWWPMNLPLVLLAAGALGYGLAAVALTPWIVDMLHNSTQFAAIDVSHNTHHEGSHAGGIDIHLLTEIISGILALTGVALAAVFYWLKPGLAGKLTAPLGPIVSLLAHKYYVDEFYDRLIVKPLRGIAYACYACDQLVVNGAVLGMGLLPRLAGRVIQPTQSGKLQGYGIGMACGLALIAFIIFWATA